MADHLRSELVLGALDMVLSATNGGVIHHAERIGYELENFFETPECDLLDRESFATREQVRMALFTYIEGWYNPRRRPSAPGDKPPVEYKRMHEAEMAVEGC